MISHKPMDRLGPLTAFYSDEIDVELLAFIERYATSLARWDILIYFGQNPSMSETVRNIATRLGRRPESLRKELEDLVYRGVLRANPGERGARYGLANEPVIRRAVIRLANQTANQS